MTDRRGWLGGWLAGLTDRAGHVFAVVAGFVIPVGAVIVMLEQVGR